MTQVTRLLVKLHFIQRPKSDAYEVVNENGEIVCTWNDEAHIDYPEDLTMDRMIGELIRQVYEVGLKHGKESK
jgi:hypothetical protein